MDKEQAWNSFWNSFGVKAYDAITVPDDATLPRITYDLATTDFNNQIFLTISIWGRSTSWKSVTDILHEVERRIGLGGCTVPYDGGMIWIKKASPFANRLGEQSDDTIRRIVVNVEVEFESEV